MIRYLIIVTWSDLKNADFAKDADGNNLVFRTQNAARKSAAKLEDAAVIQI